MTRFTLCIQVFCVFVYQQTQRVVQIWLLCHKATLTPSLHGVSDLSFANACALWTDQFVGWEGIIVRYNLLTFFFFCSILFFLFFWVDLNNACISWGTIADLSSGPKLHLYLICQGKTIIIELFLQHWCQLMSSYKYKLSYRRRTMNNMK